MPITFKEIIPGPIRGLFMLVLNVHSDHRGRTRPCYNRDEFTLSCLPSFGGTGTTDTVTMSDSYQGVVRAYHVLKNKRYDPDTGKAYGGSKLIRVEQGSAFIDLLDVREDGPTFGWHVTTVLDRFDLAIIVPGGVGNGFQALSDIMTYHYMMESSWRPGLEGEISYKEGRWPISITDPERQLSVVRDLKARTFEEIYGGTPAYECFLKGLEASGSSNGPFIKWEPRVPPFAVNLPRNP
ncbi:MAG: dTDP-4-dehydrorhamnose 3,5-epimerase family protein [Parcubacteria group bacterium]